METIYWAEIKTNVSNTFFKDEKHDYNFVKWINDRLNSNDFIVNTETFECPIDGIDSITAVVLGLTSEHILDTEISVTSKFEYDELIKNKELHRYIERTIVPQLIKSFNENCKIGIPMTKQGTFDRLIFDGDNFYTKIYYSADIDDYMSIPVHKEYLYLIPDFELQI